MQNEPQDDTLLLTPAETARLLSLGRTNIYKLLADGTIPSIRIGNLIRVPTAALKQWLAAQTSGG